MSIYQRDYEPRTQSKYTVRLLCLDLDIMADEQVWAGDGDESLEIAEKQHDGHCHRSGWACGSEAQRWEEGWVVEEPEA